MPDFKTLQATYPKDKDYPPRAFRLSALARVIDGTMYDELREPFSSEINAAGEYMPLAERRPSARTRICGTVVNDSVSLLFSEGHFPAIECVDEATRDALAKIVEETNLNEVMIDAATRGSVGSVVVHMRVLKGRVFFKTMVTAYLTPEWDPEAPDTLISVTERFKLKGQALKDSGYTIADGDLSSDFWFQRIWDKVAEQWFEPQTKQDAADEKPPVPDTARSVTHNLGFVPMVWVKNLPGGDDTDGRPTFPEEAIDIQIEADYLLSQGGRGLKYQSDPKLHIKEPQFNPNAGAVITGAANALVTGQDGDAKLLEISGDGARTVLDWVKGLRELALEGAGGNRANAEKLSAAQSGRAMELMNQSLIWLADKLRIAYGQGALLDLLNMVVRAAQKTPLVDKKGRKIGELSTDDDLSLRWPQWYAPTYADKQTEMTTLDVGRQSGLISQLTAVKSLAPSYDIADPEAEIAQIAKDGPPPNAPPAQPKGPPLSESQD